MWQCVCIALSLCKKRTHCEIVSAFYVTTLSEFWLLYACNTGLPGALAGAAMGAIGGSIAGSAMAKEWVRGEDIHSAMEFDQHQEGHKSPPPRVVSIGSTPLPEVHELTKPTQRPAEESHS